MLLDPVVFPVFIAIVAIVILAIFFHFVPFFLWLSAKVSGVHISLIQLFLMRIRNVPPGVIVPSLIEAHKAGLKNITRDNLEAHYMTGGHVQRVVHALVSASKANIDLPFEKATAIDLAGRDVFEAANFCQSEGNRHATRSRRSQKRYPVDSEGPCHRTRQHPPACGRCRRGHHPGPCRRRYRFFHRFGRKSRASSGKPGLHLQTGTQRVWMPVRLLKSCPSTLPTSTWARTSVPPCKSTKPTPTKTSRRPRPRNAVPWLSPPNRK